MAWRPSEFLIQGILDNSVRDKVTGWMEFAGMKQRVILNLKGNFHRDIRGAKVRFRGDGECANFQEAKEYMEGFSILQKGDVGDMTAGLPPCDYGALGQGYIEWYSDKNGRVVIELETDRVDLLISPIPACESDPIDRKQQAENMANFLGGVATALDIPQDNAIAAGYTVAVEKAKEVLANDKIRGMKLLPKEIREQLPPLYSQEDKGGKAIAYVKFFAPDSGSWSWYATEFDGKDTFFGLVDGHEKELGYFSLFELESVRGSLGLAIERDLYFKPTMLEELAPEMFKD